jgi:endonuclease III
VTRRAAEQLAQRLDDLEAADGRPPAVPARRGWELVLLENVGYLVDDAARKQALGRLRREVGLQPERLLAADPAVLTDICVGMRPGERAERLRRCAELRLADAAWRQYPGIGRPGAERIELFAGERAVLALESNGLRSLYRLGYGEPARSYDAVYRSVQADAADELAPEVAVLVRAHQLLRRHGQQRCTRRDPGCASCPLASGCSAEHGDRPFTDPWAR